MESTLSVAGWCIMTAVAVIRVSANQHRELEGIVSRPSEGAGLVRRARVILLSASGKSGNEIARRLDLSARRSRRMLDRISTAVH